MQMWKLLRYIGKAENIIAPGKSINMGNGWETKRRRGKGYDWIIIKLAETGSIDKFKLLILILFRLWRSLCQSVF